VRTRIKILLSISGVIALAGIVFLLFRLDDPPPERVRIVIERPGASAARIDETIGAALARSLAVLDPDVELSSTEGRAEALLEVEGEDALSRVRERVAAARLDGELHVFLDSELYKTRVRWVVRGPHAAERQRWLFEPRAERASGVSQVASCAAEDELEIRIDARRAAMHALDPIAIADAIRNGHVEQPAGVIEDGGRELLVRGHGRLSVASDLEELVIASRDAPLRLRDVATIARTSAMGCECLAASEPCATGSALARNPDVLREELREEPPTWVDDRIAIAVAPGTSRDQLRHVARGVLEAAGRTEGVTFAAVEVSAPTGAEGFGGQLALLVGVDEPAAIDRARAAIEERVPGVVLELGDPAVLFVVARDTERAETSAHEVAARLRGVAGVRRVLEASTGAAPVLRTSVDDALAARFEVERARVDRAIALAGDGEIVGELSEGRERVRLRARVDAESPLDIWLSARDGRLVPLREIATLSQSSAPVELHRCGASRCARIFVEADAAGLERVRDAIDSMRFPTGVSTRWR
jgi:multidrug efflux pump subunit AcrB